MEEKLLAGHSGPSIVVGILTHPLNTNSVLGVRIIVSILQKEASLHNHITITS